MRGTVEERFWAKVQKSDGCWAWTASKDRKGYGCFRISRREGIQAHRLSYILHFGAVLDGDLVCHHCDNPSCVRPEHLFSGSPGKNTADMIGKGRWSRPPVFRGDAHPLRRRPELAVRGDAHPLRKCPELAARGERVGGAKLTAIQVVEMRRLKAGGARTVELAKAFGVSVTNVKDIVARRIWAHVA